MARTLTASDRRSLIRLASAMPVGSPERKAILAGLSKRGGLGKKVSLQEFIEGFRPGTETRDLHMFGPLIDLRTWEDAMVAAGADQYNRFKVKNAVKWLQGHGVKKIHPARENSPAIYFQMPYGPDDEHPKYGLGVEAIFMRGRSGADEISTHEGSPEGRVIESGLGSTYGLGTWSAMNDGKRVWVRMWWD